MRSTENPSPRDTAVALLEKFHGTRADAVLVAVERGYRRTHDGESLVRPDLYLGRFDDAQLAALKPAPDLVRTAVDLCTRCDQAGWLTDAEDRPVKRCDHRPIGLVS